MSLAGIFAVAATVLLPLGAAVFLCLKRNGYLKPVLLGALTFTVFQVLTRIPLLQSVLPRTQWFLILSATMPRLYSLFLGVTAALFEEGGRYLVMRFLMRDRRRFFDGVAFGIGHGGVEAVLLVGINVLYALFTAAAVSPGAMFAAGFERLSAMAAHIAFSVMVLKSVRQRKALWLAAAFLLHAALDALSVYAFYMGVSTFAIEASLFAFGCVMVLYVVFEHKKTEGNECV